MTTIFASQFNMPCVVVDDDSETAEQVMARCWAVEATRHVDGVEFCVQLRPEVGPELWTEDALHRSLPSTRSLGGARAIWRPVVSRLGVNWPRLSVDLTTMCTEAGMTFREAAQQIGVPASGLSKLRNGGQLSADATARLVAWLYPNTIPAWITEAPS